ncbi:MAG: TerB family tellurite resistance protein, partial [Cyanobacteria bacterium P01_F01_bin.153]
VEAARQGDPMAIGQLLSQRLRSRGIQVRIRLQQGYLQIRLDSPRALPQQAIVDWTKRWIVALHCETINRVRIYAWQPNQYFPDWMARFEVMRGSLSAQAAKTNATSSPGGKGTNGDGPTVNGAGSNGFGTVGASSADISSEGAAASEKTSFQAVDLSNRDPSAAIEPGSTLDLAAIPEQDRLAYYGALYAIANADGHIDPREVAVIEEIINLEGLSDQAKDKVVNYRKEPPNLGDCLAVLAEADESLRIGLMMNLIDTSWANEELDPLEMAALKLAQRSLNISDVELESIEGFVREMRSQDAQSFDELDLNS